MDSRRTIGEVPGNSRSVGRRRPGNDGLTMVILVVFVGVSPLGTVKTYAQDATWSSTPATANWNTASNWYLLPGRPPCRLGPPHSISPTRRPSPLQIVPRLAPSCSRQEHRAIHLMFQAGSVLGLIHYHEGRFVEDGRSKRHADAWLPHLASPSVSISLQSYANAG